MKQVDLTKMNIRKVTNIGTRTSICRIYLPIFSEEARKLVYREVRYINYKLSNGIPLTDLSEAVKFRVGTKLDGISNLAMLYDINTNPRFKKQYVFRPGPYFDVKSKWGIIYNIIIDSYACDLTLFDIIHDCLKFDFSMMEHSTYYTQLNTILKRTLEVLSHEIKTESE